MESILEFDRVHKWYGATVILPEVSFVVRQQEFVSLLGPSGCGKTTMLRLIAGLEEPNTGTITLAGRPVAGPKVFVPPEKRNLGMVFQSYAVWPHMTVFDNIAYPLRIKKIASSKITKQVGDVLATLKMDKLAKRMPSELSGGQQQRVALGRALVMDPVILLLDEPLSNLDAKLRVEMRKEMKGLQARFRTSIVYVTHDQEEAFELSDRILVINHGTIEQDGTPAEIRKNPKTEFVREFVS